MDAPPPAPAPPPGPEPDAPAAPPHLVFEEEVERVVPLPFAGATRVFLDGLPPGAVWDEATRTLTFRPDFTQGGATWRATATLRAGRDEQTRALAIEVRDTIRPPPPVVLREERREDHRRLVVAQTTDAWLDSPGRAGRTLEATVIVPDGATAAHRVPVQIGLHGFNGSPSDAGNASRFRLYPHDPDNTYWWGYGEVLAGRRGPPPTRGVVPPYTLRRVLHLLDWLLATQPGADPERVYLYGGSMGGAGAKLLGLLHARHFCYAVARIGQAIARNHRPSRVEQLATLWGAPTTGLADHRGRPVWDTLDMTRALTDSPEARDQLLLLKHGKDDGIIHFGAVTQASPLTGRSLYETLQQERLGHLAVWDEGGHGSLDPVLGGAWWDLGRSRIFGPITFVRRDLAFPAFSRSSADRDPGDGRGNGRVPWDDERGFAGQLSVPGDTGWSGELAGALNRFLRWDAAAIVDTHDAFGIPLRVIDGFGEPPPAPGYPTLGERLDAPLPVVVDVTPRRVQRFRCLPGEEVAWSFGPHQGVATADADGSVTVRRLPLTPAWTTLMLSRL